MTKTEELSFKEKLNNLRDDAVRADWTRQGVVDLGRGTYLYITLDQMKSVFNPLFAKHRLLFNPTMLPPTPMGSASAPSAWMVHLQVTIEDVDSDESVTYDYYGHNAKLNFAISFAEKSFFSTVFLNADGTNPEESDNDGATYVPLKNTPSEKLASVAKIKEAAAKPKPAPAPSVKPEPEPVAAPAPEVPAEPAEQPAPVAVTNADIPDTTARAISNIVEKVEEKFKKGELAQADYDMVKEAAGSIKDKQSANMFVIKFRKIVRS